MDITDEDRRTVLARYAALRGKRLGSPASCMAAIRDAAAWDVLNTLAMGIQPNPADVREWAAARDYRVAMEGRPAHWFRRPRCSQ